MTEHELPVPADDVPPPAASAGTLLARSREASGMSIEDVAAQLKLAPRQVVAIERDDFASLPGRTFIRGFVRNYARLLKLDVDAVLAALPGEGASPAPDRPLAATTSRSIGEMPREPGPRPGIARWAIPLVLVAIVAVAAFYEFARPPAPARPAAIHVEPPVAAPPPAAPVSPPADPAGESRAPETTGAARPASSTELPNPLANAGAAASPAPAPAPAAATEPAVVATPPAPAASPGAVRNQLALAFRGTSWLEVRDRSGNVVLSMTGTGGTTRELPVVAPGEVIIGNAAVVDANWRGKPIDLAPYTKQNVARVRLD